jgi:hypothetical protein
MAVEIVNLTLLKVKEELDLILENYPNQIYQKTLTDHDMRQQLIVYVLNRLPNRHLAIDIENISLIRSKLVNVSTQESLKIENLIHQGIYQLNQKDKVCDFYYASIKEEASGYRLNLSN